MKDTVQHVQHIVDTKVVSSAAISGSSWLVTQAEAIQPIVAVASGLVAIIAGVMAVIWTGMRIYDRYKGK